MGFINVVKKFCIILLIIVVGGKTVEYEKEGIQTRKRRPKNSSGNHNSHQNPGPSGLNHQTHRMRK